MSCFPLTQQDDKINHRFTFQKNVHKWRLMQIHRKFDSGRFVVASIDLIKNQFDKYDFFLKNVAMGKRLVLCSPDLL